MADNYKSLPVSGILTESSRYMLKHPKHMAVFGILNFIIILFGFYTWQQPAFFLVLIAAYMFWGYFFRWYFDKKPYLQTKPIVSSLTPSVKILLVGFLIVTALILLPFAPLLLGLSQPDYLDGYMHFLEQGMEESPFVDLVLSLIMLFISPFMLFRPFFAWIGALLGRNGSLHFAMSKTRGNYWNIVMLLLVLNLPIVLVEQLCLFLDMPRFVMILLMSPLIIYFNVVVAGAYNFFFIKED